MSLRGWLTATVAATVLAMGGAHAHGVGARALGSGAQSVEFYYITGEPMAYVAVRLFAPGDAAVPFIDGRADRLGRFAFLPSEPGTWIARAEDEEGHKVELTVQAGATAVADSAPGGLPMKWRAALWLSLSANLLAVTFWIRPRRPVARIPSVAE